MSLDIKNLIHPVHEDGNFRAGKQRRSTVTRKAGMINTGNKKELH